MITTNTFDAKATAATTLIAKAQAQVATIQANADLTMAAKATRIADVRSVTETRVAQLRADAEASLAADLETLRRRVFAAPLPAGSTAADQIAVAASSRDALDRAGRVAADPQQLAAMLDRAFATADLVQARAVLVVAIESGFVDVIHAYMAARPAEAQTIADYINLAESIGDPTAKLQRAFAFSGMV